MGLCLPNLPEDWYFLCQIFEHWNTFLPHRNHSFFPPTVSPEVGINWDTDYNVEKTFLHHGVPRLLFCSSSLCARHEGIGAGGLQAGTGAASYPAPALSLFQVPAEVEACHPQISGDQEVGGCKDSRGRKGEWGWLA